MNEYCECALAGYCTRHQMMKGQARFNLCKGLGKPKDCGLSYWQSWEQGKLGATAPNNPQLNPNGFCTSKQLTPPLAVTKSSIGTRLHDIIFRETGAEVPCEECKERILMLNQMDKKQVVDASISVIKDILDRSAKVAPKLWQKIGITLDNILHTGIAEAKITSWVDEAINSEPDFVLIENKSEQSNIKKKTVCKACG